MSADRRAETLRRYRARQTTADTVGYIDLLVAGVDPRHADYWTMKGWLRTSTDSPVGQGNSRRYPQEELPIAVLMERLTWVGVKAANAEKMAREAMAQVEVVGFPVRVNLAVGVWLDVSAASIEPTED